MSVLEVVRWELDGGETCMVKEEKNLSSGYLSLGKLSDNHHFFLLNPSLRRHAQSTAQMPNPIKSFSPKARFKVEECRAKV